MRALAAALLAAACGAAQGAGEVAAPAWPTIRAIDFAGNDTTQPAVLLREMVVRVGDPADPELLERSRQAIQDLRLFSSVSLEQGALDGGVRVLVTVREKYYVLPLPRASLNSDGQYSYGVGMRWWNVLGLNHTLHVTVEQGDRREAGRGAALEYRASYEVPFLLDSPFGLSLDYDHSEQAAAFLFDEETRDSVRWLFSRAFSDGSASHGWRLGAGVQWQDQQRTGFAAATSPGHATALVLDVRHDKMLFDLYSERGRSFSLEGRATAGEWASDYAFRDVSGHYEQSWAVGTRAHQTFGIYAHGGAYGGGPGGVPPPYALGGAESLRGYELNTLRGSHYYLAGMEYLRPLHWNWLRGVAFFEAGNALGDGSDLGADGVLADVGVGLRLRLSGFVDTELNIGLAYPLVDAGSGGAGRFFATGHR
jgi:outer membrane protein assembly factor BamA